MMQIEDIIERFNTTPFLFIGSGMFSLKKIAHI